MRVLFVEGPENLLGTVRQILQRERSPDVLAVVVNDSAAGKRVPAQELVARLQGLIRDAKPANEPILRAHDLEIDTVNRTVQRAGRPVYLTPHEFALLELLARHRGKLVTRLMIWRHMYDEKEEFSDNRVNVFIRLLRRKIDKGFDYPLIETRWGLGYCLRGDGAGQSD